MRAFLLYSRAGRVLCVAVLALFLLLCGIHIGSAHHDGHGDSFGLAQQLILFVALAIVSMVSASAVTSRLPGLPALSRVWVAAPLREPPSVDLGPGIPLLC